MLVAYQLLQFIAALYSSVRLWFPGGQQSKAAKGFGRNTQKRKRRAMYFNHPKPKWVPEQIIGLKARMPECGCRKIAHQFNALYAHRGVRVSNSYVYGVFIRHHYEIVQRQKAIKSAKPNKMLPFGSWAMDLTKLTAKDHSIIGLIDEGSRACLELKQLRDKSSLRLLHVLIGCVLKYGFIPKRLKTDNEAVFTSWIFKVTLRFMGIRHVRTQMACPWMNGRIERFFGTFKLYKAQLKSLAPEWLDEALGKFRRWYNHYRPHENLGGLMPGDVWAGEGRHVTKAQITGWHDWLRAKAGAPPDD